MTSLTLFTPAGVVAKAAPLRLAAKRLQALGFDVTTDEAALARHQRCGGESGKEKPDQGQHRGSHGQAKGAQSDILPA